MSETAPEAHPRPAVRPAPAAGGGNILTRKVGPLPTWAWLGVIGVGGAGLWYLFKRRQESQAGTSTATADTGTGNVQTSWAGQIATLQTEIQDLEGRTSQPVTTTKTGTSTGTTKTGTSTSTSPIGPGGTPIVPNIHFYTSNGKLTLAEVAKEHNTTPAKIVADTKKYKNNVSKTLADYFSKGKWNNKIPKGTTIIYENG